MDLEQTIQQLPKPVLAIIVIFVAIILFLILQPPHTICDTQKENLKAGQKGILFPIKSGKYTYPGKILKARESCSWGNSSGACYEYFGILRRAALAVKNTSSECTADMLGISIENYAKTETYEQVRDGAKMREELSKVSYSTVNLEKVFSDGLEMLVRKAWGEVPPDPGPTRFGWLQEYELGVFCHLQDVLRKAKGHEGWLNFQRTVMQKLPGEAAPVPTTQTPIIAPPRRATEMMMEAQISERSLFSVNCGNYR